MAFDRLSITTELRTDKDILLSVAYLTVELLTPSTHITKWKLCLPLMNMIKEVSEIRYELSESITTNIRELYGTFDEYMCKVQNLQHIFFVITFLKELNITPTPGIFDKKLLNVLSAPLGRDRSDTILKFLLESNKSLFHCIFQPVSLRCTSLTGSDPIIITGIRFSDYEASILINLVYDKVYIWGGSGLCIELNRSDYSIFKNLKNEITLHRDKFETNSLNILRNSQCLQKFSHSLSDLSFNFKDRDNAQVFFDACQNKVKISQSANIIALDYADYDELSEDEPVEEVTEDGNDRSVSEIKEPLEGENSEITSQQSLVRLMSDPVTPNGTEKRNQTDEWQLKDPSASEQEAISSEKDTSVSLEVSVEPEPSPTVLAQERRKTRALTKERNEGPEQSTDTTINTSVRHAPSLIITKCEHKITKREKQNEITRDLRVNKKDKVTKPDVNTTRTNINLLNSIFDIGNASTTKRLKKNAPKNKSLAWKQQKLPNIKEYVTIESQDVVIRDDDQKNTVMPTEHPTTVGPALRTRLQRKGKPKTNKADQPSDNRFSLITKTSDSVAKEKESDPNAKKKDLQISEGQICTVPMESNTALPNANMEKTNLALHKRQNDNNNRPSASEETHNNELTTSALQESTTIVNSKTPMKSFPAGLSAPMLDPHSFTDLLQAQINNSVSAFTSDLTKKLQIVNEELNTKILADLSKKYEAVIQDMRSKFEGDTQNILRFISDLPSLLLLPESDLRQRIHDCVHLAEDDN